jgi:hypothetical protein
VLFCLLDGGLTLQGQPDAYWQDYGNAEELNPLGLWPLQRHPLLFVAALLCWVVVFCTSIVLLSDNLARPLSFVVQLGHTVGGASWLGRPGGLSWMAAALLLLASRAVLDLTWRRANPADRPSPGVS